MKKYIIFICIIILSLFVYQPIDTNVIITAYYPRIDCKIQRIRIPIINHKVVGATAYNATREQCDSTPDIASWGDRITDENKNKIIAISRDLVPLLSRNTKVSFYHDDILHSKLVLDKMGKYGRKGKKNQYKITNCIDVLMDRFGQAKQFGRRKKKIFWFGGEAEFYIIEIGGSIEIMRDKVQNILLPDCEILEVSKLGYVRVKTKDGTELYVSTDPPKNKAMYTDFYQFTKMAMYVESGKTDEPAVFESIYRRNPFSGGFAIAAGLGDVVEYLEKLQFTGRDIDYLQGVWKFPDRFWEYLREFKWKGTLRAISEGSMVQPRVPLTQICSTLPIGDFVETRILSLIGGPTAIATKAARMAIASSTPWIEMAARRAPSYDTGMNIAKYSYIGGAGTCIGTSLVSAGQEFGIPIHGTTSHSSVLAFDTQQFSYRSHADIFREKSVFILDTYGYINGTMDAITVGKEMGLNSFGGRIDGNPDELEFQSRVVKEILRENGFKDAKVLLSGDIDEYIRRNLITGDGQGIGTAMVVPPLDVVYKPVVINGRYVVKLGNPSKVTEPAVKDVFRMQSTNGKTCSYVITESTHRNVHEHQDELFQRLHNGEYHRKLPESDWSDNKIHIDSSVICHEEKLLPTLIDYERKVWLPDIETLRNKVDCELRMMPDYIKEFEHPAMTENFPVLLSHGIWEIREKIKKKYNMGG